MADFAVSTAFTAKDGVSEKLRTMSRGANKFGHDAEGAFSKAAAMGSRFKETLGAFLSAQVIGRGVALLTQGLRSLTEEVVHFDDAIVGAGAKFPEKVVRGTRAFEELETVARKVGAETKFTATEAAEGLDYLAMAGFNAKQAIGSLPQVVNMAIVAKTDLARATDIASDALGAFGLMTQDTGKLTTNLARINDVFAKTVTSSNTTLEMMYEGMKSGAPVVTAAGQSIETYSALVGKLANAGIKGEMAGTAIRNIFLNLQSKAPAVTKELRKLNMEVIDEHGNLRDIVEILGDFNARTEKMGKAQRSAALETIFGKRAIAAVSVLLDQGADSIHEYRNALWQSSGEADKMAKIIQDSLGNRLAALKSAAIEAGMKFVDAFRDKMPGAIDSFTAAIRNLDVKGFVDNLVETINVLRDVKNAAAPLTPLVWGMVGAWGAYKAIMIAKSFSAGIAAITAGQWGLNAAMAANPIGVVVVAIGALVAAGVMLYNQLDNIKEITAWVWENIKDLGRGIDANTESVKNWKAGVEVLGNAWDVVSEKFSAFINNFRAGTKVLSEIPVIGKLFDQNVWTGERGGGYGSKPQGTRGLSNAAWEEPMNATSANQMATDETAKAQQAVAQEKAREEKQLIGFYGRLDIAGAPPGSKVSGKTIGAPPINMSLLGDNP